MAKTKGKKSWAFGAGHIPLHSTGNEPAFTSRDQLAILNTSEKSAAIILTIFYESESPVENYKIEVAARRVRKIRLNDLIDPLPIPLDKSFGFTIESDVPVIIQHSRMNTGSRNLAGFCVTPYHQPS